MKGNKFNIFDRVKVVNTQGINHIYRNRTGVVLSVRQGIRTFMYNIRLDDTGRSAGFYEYRLELVPKVTVTTTRKRRSI